MARPKKPENQLKEIKQELAVLTERVKILKSKAGKNLMADVNSVLAQLTQLSSDVDALIAKPVPVADLQPISDAITAISQKVTTATAA